MKKFLFKIFFAAIFISALILARLVFYPFFKNIFIPAASVPPSPSALADTPEVTPSGSPILSAPPELSPSPFLSPEVFPDRDVYFDVPFTSQAPFGDWADSRQQDGCEEASALMAVSWARGESLSLEKSLDEILAISNYEEKNYGNYHDTDAEDTAEIIYRGYFKYGNIEVRHQISAYDIKQELFKGNLVVVPANGRRLGNPHYTPPGPLEHNIVIRGYDAAKKEFITNDPGTQYGKNYKYKENVLENALMDYPTGYKEPVVPGKTAMIVVRR